MSEQELDQVATAAGFKVLNVYEDPAKREFCMFDGRRLDYAIPVKDMEALVKAARGSA
jgi:hypothetical protein